MTFSTFIPNASLSHDERVIELLKECEQSLPPVTISLLLGIDRSLTTKILKRMERRGEIRITTKKPSNFYTVRELQRDFKKIRLVNI